MFFAGAHLAATVVRAALDWNNCSWWAWEALGIQLGFGWEQADRSWDLVGKCRDSVGKQRKRPSCTCLCFQISATVVSLTPEVEMA